MSTGTETQQRGVIHLSAMRSRDADKAASGPRSVPRRGRRRQALDRFIGHTIGHRPPAGPGHGRSLSTRPGSRRHSPRPLSGPPSIPFPRLPIAPGILRRRRPCEGSRGSAHLRQLRRSLRDRPSLAAPIEAATAAHRAHDPGDHSGNSRNELGNRYSDATGSERCHLQTDPEYGAGEDHAPEGHR
jgi:hypothetical protein